MKTFLALCMVVAVGVLTGCLTARTTGKLISYDGTYEGEIKAGKASGQGTRIHPDGSKYVGEWKVDKYDGQGTLTKPDGTTQSGVWEKGKYIGPATNAPTGSGADKKK